MKSICVKVCEYEETPYSSDKDETRICKGCGRTDTEITEWFYATKERKIEIAKLARSRSKAIKAKKI